jgi:hypothetical protein
MFSGLRSRCNQGRDCLEPRLSLSRMWKGRAAACVPLLILVSCSTSAAKQQPRLLVPGHPRSLTIAVYGGAPIHYQRTVQIKKRRDVDTVVRDMNAMHHRRTEGAFSCGLGRTLWYEILTFSYANAPPLRAHVYAICPRFARAHGLLAGADMAFLRLAKFIDHLIGRRPACGPCTGI